MNPDTSILPPAFRRLFREQSGQTLVMVAMMMVILLGFCGLIVDVGHAYFCFRELQASTDAAALAGGEALGQPSLTPNLAAIATATQYSSVPGNMNAFGNLKNVSMVLGYPKVECLATLQNQGIPCDGLLSWNAIQVKQTMSMPTMFAALFGTKTIPMTATATSSMAGAATSAYNVAIIIDSTRSMQDLDGGSNCLGTRLTCALTGVQVLLQELAPCSSSAILCSVSAGVAVNPVDQVSLFTFPMMTTTSVSLEYDCSSTNPTVNPYTFPSPNATTSTTPNFYIGTGNNKTTVQMTSQITPFLSDYRTSDTVASLNVSSIMTKAIGGGACVGMSAPGGEGTYYASAIYQAQGALLAQQAANPGSLNVIILLSDGDASATSSQMASGTQADVVANLSGLYPSYKNECGQAILAAKAAAANQIRVYAVAYGATATGCSTDTSGTYAGYTPCQTMQAIASSPAYFYSDYSAGGSGVDKSCISGANSTTNLNQIFTDIATSFTVARLIPDGTT